MTRSLSGILVLVWLALNGSGAQAHVISKSHSTWEFTGTTARVEFRIPAEELSNLPAVESPVDYWPAHLKLFHGDEEYPATSALKTSTGADGWIIYRWDVECPVEGTHTIRSDLLRGLVPQHVHLARVVDESGGFREKVLVGSDPVWALEDNSGHGTSLGGYFLLGVEHILGGWDHLAFVLALVLLVGSFGEVLKLVTGFTIAHSLTLGLAALGLLRPDTAAVEILIGFSIALVAAENCWLLGGKGRGVPLVATNVLAVAGFLALGSFGLLTPLTWFGLALFTFCHFRLLGITNKGQFLRAMIAFSFGLIHGFGFGGALMEIGLPSDRIVPALLGFNVGVEVGQLMVVALVFPVLKLIYRGSENRGRLVAEVCSAGVFAVGLYWMVTRNWGA